MPRIPVFFALAAGVAALSGTALADVVDQNNPDEDVYMVPSDTSGFLAQSFKQTANNISGAGVFFTSAYGGSDTITFTVYDNDPYYGGQPIPGATGSASGNGYGIWVDAFWSPVSITPGQQYFLQIKGQSGSATLAGTYYYDKYADGSLHYYGTDYGPYGYDMTFRTYAADVPSPASAALLGLGGLAATRRRRA